MKVWISKYALTTGIFETEVERCEASSNNDNSDMVKAMEGRSSIYYFGEGKDWHLTRDEAIIKAEEMRFKKIESIKKQLNKLEKLKF